MLGHDEEPGDMGMNSMRSKEGGREGGREGDREGEGGKGGGGKDGGGKEIGRAHV